MNEVNHSIALHESIVLLVLCAAPLSLSIVTFFNQNTSTWYRMPHSIITYAYGTRVTQRNHNEKAWWLFGKYSFIYKLLFIRTDWRLSPLLPTIDFSSESDNVIKTRTQISEPSGCGMRGGSRSINHLACSSIRLNSCLLRIQKQLWMV